MKNKKQYSGQTLVEFALLFPIFLILVLGFFDLGRAVFYYSSLTNAVRETARYAIVHSDHSNLKEMVLDKYAFGINPGDINVIEINYFDEGNLNDSVDPLTEDYTNIAIRAEYIFDPVTPFINRFGCCGGIRIVAESNMRISTPYR
jgi:hypothetical protein